MATYLSELYRAAWRGSPAQWTYLAIIAGALLCIVLTFASACRQAAAERHLLRAVLAMARVPDDGTAQSRRDKAKAPPAEVAPSSGNATSAPRRLDDAAGTALRRGQSSVAEVGCDRKACATARRQSGP